MAILIAAAAWAAFLNQDPDYDKLLNAAKYTLTESVDLAIKDFKEAKEATVVGAVLSESSRGQVFTVLFAKGDKTYGYSLRSSDGKYDSASRGNLDQSALAAAVKIKLNDAIAAALKKVNGKAVEARFGMAPTNKPFCQVYIFDEGKIRTATVDAVTGIVTYVKDGK